MADTNAQQQTNREQLFIDLYKKQSKLTWYASEKASASMYKAWSRCYALALMLAPLPDCGAATELHYEHGQRLKRFASDSINIAYACSDLFAPFCGVSVYSLISNSDKDKNYDIIIMHAGSLSEPNKRHLCALADGKSNISIRIIDCLNSQVTSEGHLRSYFSAEVYFRCLLLTDFFCDYDRFVYLDSDTIVNTDISALFSMDMSGKAIAAVVDLCMEYLVNSGSSLVLKGTVLSYGYYLRHSLGLDDATQYFNSGVMLMDVGGIRAAGSRGDVFNMVQSGNYYCFEQCVLNSAFKNNVEYLSQVWNVQNVTNVYANYKEHMSQDTLSHLKLSIPGYKIMHYVGPNKPWYNPDAKSSSEFTAYASGTAWFRTIIYASLTDKAEEFLQSYYGRHD